jgi:tellurite resistance protein
MHPQDLAIVRGLVSVAWADGRIADEELEVIDAVLAAYNATPSETREIRKYAGEKRTLDDIELTELSLDDRRVLLQHSVLLTFVDGEQHDKEKRVLNELVDRLRLTPAESARIMSAAEMRAKEMLGKLDA